MSDGGSGATPGHRHVSDPLSDEAGSAPDEQPVLGAAPWERFSEPASDLWAHHWSIEPPVEAVEAVAAVEPVEADDTEQGGCHTGGGVSVADLIAKIGAASTAPPTHHHVEPDIEPDIQPDIEAEIEPPGVVTDEDDDDLQDTQVLPAYSFDLLSELPDLGTRSYPHGADDDPESDSEQPGEVWSAPTGVRPRRMRRKSAGESPETTKPQRKSRRRPMLLAGRSLAALIAVLALALTGGAWQWSTSKNNSLNIVSALDPDSRDIVDPTAQYGDENFLIAGMDSRLGENANMGAGDADDAGGARSDTVMLVNIPANRKRVVVVSFPRDLAITPMQCEAWNPESGRYGPIYDPKTGTTGPRMIYTETKLNSAFSFGGPKCLVKVIQKLSGLSINRFMAVDFAGFARMVEALGGVEVCTKTPLKDYELGTILEHSGRQVINGPTALSYVRARQVTTEENGDYGRIKRQQMFLSSLLRALISEDTLFNLNKLNNVVNLFINDSYVDNVKTKDLVQLGQSLQGMAAGHITFVTVPTGVTDQDGNEPPRTSDMRALFDAIINDDPLPGENDANAQNLGKIPTTAPTTKKPPPASATPESQPQQVTTTSPQDITVQVSNATGQTGLATTATNQLKRNGFNVMTPNDYSSSLTSTTVFFSPGNEQAAATVASSFANSKVARVSGIGQVVQVVLGSDFSAVSAPAPSGSSMRVQIDRNSSGPPTRLPEDLTVTNAADTSCG